MKNPDLHYLQIVHYTNGDIVFYSLDIKSRLWFCTDDNTEWRLLQ